MTMMMMLFHATSDIMSLGRGKVGPSVHIVVFSAIELLWFNLWEIPLKFVLESSSSLSCTDPQLCLCSVGAGERKSCERNQLFFVFFFCNLNIKAITSTLYLNEWKFVRKNLYSSYFFLIFFRRIGSSCRTRGEWQHDFDLHLPHTARSELRSIVWRLLAGSYSPHCAAISLG